MTTTYATENDAERRRLFEITARLTEEELARSWPDGWSAATKLAHLAFWDLYYLSLLQGWERTGFAAAPTNTDAINEAVLTLSRSIPPKAVVQLVRDAAEALDRKLAELAPELATAIERAGYVRILNRSLHRRAHLDEIE